MNLGIAELWSLRIDGSRRHLEEVLTSARRAEGPYLEVGCLAHLGIAAPDAGASILESHPVHRTAHAALLSETLGLLSG
jgi:hypothetical protein